MRFQWMLSLAATPLAAQLLYVPDQGGAVYRYVINPDAGSLAESLPRQRIPGWPESVAGDPTGKFLFFGYHSSETQSPSLGVFAVNQANGGLSITPGSPYRLNGQATDIKADPGGKWVYVANGGGNVAGYAVSAANGALTAIPGSPFAAGSGPARLAITPSSKFLYVSNRNAASVSAFSINETTGALARVSGSPFAVQTGPSGLAIHPNGRFLYVTNQERGTVSAFTIDESTGALAPVPGSPFPAGAGPDAAALDPAGKLLIVSNGESSTFSVYWVNAETGALSPVPSSPVRCGRGPIDVVVDPSGKTVYVVNLLDNNLSSYFLNPETGQLTPAPGSPFPTGGGPRRAALLRTGTAVRPPVLLYSALNAASLAPPESPAYGIAQGSTFLLSGLNLGPAEMVRAASFPLTESLAGTAVKVALGDTTVNALIVSTSVTRVLAILPSATPPGDGMVTVTFEGRTSAPVRIRVVAAAPGLFTRNELGYGPASARNQSSPEEQPANAFTESARPGQSVVLLATGLGPASVDETQPAPAQNLRDDVEVWVANRRVTPTYSGRSPEYPGIDHVIFTLPEDVPQGCYVPVAIKIAGQPTVSNFASISIAGGGKNCTDPHTRSWADFASGAPETVRVGWLQFLRLHVTATLPGLGTASGLLDTGWAEFFRWDSAGASRDQGLDLFTGRGVSLGGCSVRMFQGQGPGWHPARASFLHAGAELTASASKSSGRLNLTRDGFYEAHKALGVTAPPELPLERLPPPFLEPGTIQIANGAGGSDIGRFETTLKIPESLPALEWTNLRELAASGIDRPAGLTFTWTGGDPAAEYVVLAGVVLLPGNFDDDITFAAAFVCAENAGAGQFAVPPTVLQALPASNFIEPLSGILLVGRAPLLSSGLEFTAPGLDIGYLSYAAYHGATTVIR